MKHRKMAFLHLALVAGPLLLAPAGKASPSAGVDDKVAELVESGRYREAYEALAGKEPTDLEAYDGTARLVLDVAMRSPDSYPRWFALRAARQLDDRMVAQSARRLAGSGDRYERALALEILARADPIGSRKELLEALDSPFRSVRIRALMGLEQIHDPVLVENFADRLRDDPDPDLRAMAARALGAAGSQKALPALREAMEDPVDVVQEEATRSLVKLGDKRVSETLRQRLGDESFKIRLSALRLAALVPDPGLVPDIAPFLGRDDPEVRAFAAAAIVAIADRAEARTHKVEPH